MSNHTSSVATVLNNTKQYSTVNKNNNNYSNSTVEGKEVLKALPDLIPNDGYNPFYLQKLKQLGYNRFMELAAKARAGSDTPERLFCWFLKNNEIVQ